MFFFLSAASIATAQVTSNNTALIPNIIANGTFGGGNLTGAVTLTITGPSNVTIGPLTGVGSLTVNTNGAGTSTGRVILTGNNTYNGGTTLTAGTLQIGDFTNSTARIGPGNLNITGGTLAFNLTATSTHPAGFISLTNCTVAIIAGGSPVSLDGTSTTSSASNVALTVGPGVTLTGTTAANSLVIRGTRTNAAGSGVSFVANASVNSSGNVGILGFGTGTSSNRQGMIFNGSASLTSSAGGTLTLEGNGQGTQGDHGVRQVGGGANTITTSGAVTINANAGWGSGFDSTSQR